MPSRRQILAFTSLFVTLPLLPRPACSAGNEVIGPLKLGFIGAGQVGSTLAGFWLRGGRHPVMLSARTLSEAQSVADNLGGGARAGTPQEAAAFADIVVLAVPYGALPAVARDLGGSVSGKILLDATNPYSWRDGAIAAEAARDGAGVVTARYFPQARLVRGFNSIAMTALRAEANETPRIAIPLAGDDQAALATVSGLTREAGFEPVVTGGLSSAKLFQPGNPGFEAVTTAPALRAQLGLKPA
ncbi:oxidoreductase [Acetobacter musti]|uniref:Oxidoreductase n=1 Tax=Acetobacter musti TaxID=864732 RepID=A0ABX0JRC9_9PROT|nr:NAD(P)-binding domain-containing protein [Acetobacter musti]NHN85105.1 oxidoreductase [Acetobacter musti]